MKDSRLSDHSVLERVKRYFPIAPEKHLGAFWVVWSCRICKFRICDYRSPSLHCSGQTRCCDLRVPRHTVIPRGIIVPPTQCLHQFAPILQPWPWLTTAPALSWSRRTDARFIPIALLWLTNAFVVSSNSFHRLLLLTLVKLREIHRLPNHFVNMTSRLVVQYHLAIVRVSTMHRHMHLML